jgi:hypothetical protein
MSGLDNGIDEYAIIYHGMQAVAGWAARAAAAADTPVVAAYATVCGPGVKAQRLAVIAAGFDLSALPLAPPGACINGR